MARRRESRRASSTDGSPQFACHRTRLANGSLRHAMVSLVAIVAAAALAVVTRLPSLQSAEAAFAACAAAPSSPGDRRTNKAQLKVATFNAAFLFLGTESHDLSCPGDDCPWTTAADAASHVTQIATVIKALNADIVQMNEVEDCTVLQSVITKLGALGDSTYKPYLVKGTDTSTGQNSALLTRVDPVVDLQRTEVRATIPVSGSTCPSSSGYSSSKGVSKHLYTTFNVTGFSKPITLVGAHLLANPESKPRCFEREAQATVLAGLAQAAVEQGHHAIITGDLNDWSVDVLDKNSNKPISAVLSILAGDNFVEVASKVAQSERYSEWYDEDGDCVYEDTEVSSLDHILVSKSLSTALSSVSFNHNLYTTSCSGYNSDHYPVSIVLSNV
ncbi:hypothetical protein PF005_g17023 [Phytophthora fragariae]|uniref:Endonuclease/exonuclease/phosphatase domain-containing protein n=3 Tax=Phytophthora TaxID=4783 RepID=A0A6A3YLT8_9STRA|nr:hypothetical protein PF003_g28338 [Phytophthora fragariae]KAE9002333.1 hypothetical protein PR002_g17658 [Phytophthora rubi]KAE8934989.1 hypothetical protein PF009_g15047 [Phytophthora fragariae]KAE9083584.1 hypothetical protein PF007_g21836 [Phytophthora fragariae]KAE9103074.1 hypothetical protein PF010_g13869 [Phytophthora fragariae]